MKNSTKNLNALNTENIALLRIRSGGQRIKLSLWCIHCTLQFTKRRHRTVKKSSPYPHPLLSCAWLKASGSEWVIKFVRIKFCQIEKFKASKNLLKWFRVTLKALLGLAKSNQYSQAVLKEGFRVIFWAGKAPFFMIPNIRYYYSKYNNFTICFFSFFSFIYLWCTK